MVKKHTIVIFSIGICLVVIFACYIMIPRGGTIDHGAAISIKTALGVYKDRNGGHPGDLRHLSNILKEVSRIECTIVKDKIESDKYLIKLFDKLYTYEVDLEYKLGSNNILEKFHVLEIRRNAANS